MVNRNSRHIKRVDDRPTTNLPMRGNAISVPKRVCKTPSDSLEVIVKI